MADDKKEKPKQPQHRHDSVDRREPLKKRDRGPIVEDRKWKEQGSTITDWDKPKGPKKK